MKCASPFVKEVQELLNIREQELLTPRSAVWTFLDAKHSSKDIAEYQRRIRSQEKDLGTIFHWLLDPKDKPKDFQIVANDLCQRCRDLGKYTEAMTDALNDDFKHHHEREAGEKFDLLKNATFILTVPGFCVAAHKAGVGNNYLTITQATALGFGVSSTILLWKRIVKGFKAAGDAVCDKADEIRNSFLVFCARETIRENQKTIAAIFSRKHALH